MLFIGLYMNLMEILCFFFSHGGCKGLSKAPSSCFHVHGVLWCQRKQQFGVNIIDINKQVAYGFVLSTSG